MHGSASGPAGGHSVVSLGPILEFPSASLHPGVLNGEFKVGGGGYNPGLASHPGGWGKEVILEVNKL